MDFTIPSMHEVDLWQAIRDPHNIMHGWNDSGILFIGDSISRSFAIKIRKIEKFYVTVVAMGGATIAQYSANRWQILDKADRLLCEYPRLGQEAFVLQGGTNDLDRMARSWRLEDSWKIQDDVGKLVQAVKKWVDQHRSRSRRIFIVGIMNRFDRPRRQPGDRQTPLCDVDFMKVRDMGINEYNRQMSNCLAAPSTGLYFIDVYNLLNIVELGDGLHPEWRDCNQRARITNAKGQVQFEGSKEEFSPTWKYAGYVRTFVCKTCRRVNL
jgi:hypothetical protein